MIGKLVKRIGPKYLTVAKTWVPTLTIWGTAGSIAVVYFTDWKLVLKYVPYINGKFKKDE